MLVWWWYGSGFTQAIPPLPPPPICGKVSYNSKHLLNTYKMTDIVQQHATLRTKGIVIVSEYAVHHFSPVNMPLKLR